MNALQLAYSVRELLNAADCLEKAGGHALRDDQLFKRIHELRMKVWELVQKQMKIVPSEV